MTRKLPICLGALLLSACAVTVEQATDAVSTALAQQGDYELLSREPYGDDVVCGTYRVVGAWGEPGREQRWIYYDGEARIYNTPDDVAVFCSDSPAAALAQRFGVTMGDSRDDPTHRVLRDFQALTAALEQYYETNGSYPSTAQGLAALVTKPTQRPIPRNYPEGGFLDALPSDPWQRPYHYEGPQFAGAKTPYTLLTRGADNAPGGEGAAADIRASMLPYLEFVAKRL